MPNCLLKKGLVYTVIFLFIGSCLVNTISSNTTFNEEVDQKQTSMNSNSTCENPEMIAQSFKPTLNTLTRVRLRGGGQSSGYVKVSIRSNLSGSDLTAKTLPAVFPTDSWINFNFPDIAVIPEETYYIIWSPTAANNSSSWFAMDSGNPYGRGEMWTSSGSGSVWTNWPNRDHTFKTYGLNNSRPSVSISYPDSEDYVYETITITGTASDPDGDYELIKVSIRIDGGSWKIASGTTSWSRSWDTTSVSDGEHVIEAKSNDGVLDSVIDSVTVNVINDNYPPSVAINYPNDNDTVRGIITIQGNASDVDGNVTKVEIQIDNDGWNTANGINSWNYSWDTNLVSDSVHTIFARSYDGDIYSANHSVNVIVNNAYSEVVIDRINGGFRANAVIKNIGTVSATDVDWYIDLEGGFILAGGFSNGTISELGGSESTTVRLSSLVGLLETMITVSAGDATKQATGFMLGPLVLGVQEI